MTPGQTTAPPPPRTAIPKLRSSCNSCGSAKVRCDRGRPECRRCVTLGLECIYGVSRKFGRPPRGKLRIDTNPDIEVRRTPQERRLPSRGGLVNFTNAVAEQSRHASFTGQPNLSSPTSESLPFGFDLDPPLTINHDNQFGFELLDPLLLGEWPRIDTPDPDVNNSSSSRASTLNVGGQHIPRTEGPRNGVNQNTSDSHSCARESYEILADLICPGPDLHAPDTNSKTVTAHLDQVLHFNRNAIDRLSRLLQCSCAKSGHRVMIHASIISRILIWYQQAGGWTRSGSPAPRDSSQLDIADDLSSGTSPSPGLDGVVDRRTTGVQTLSQTTGFVVTDVPVSLGTFGIEDQKMQASIRNHLVLSELGKMSRLIDLFSSHFSSESSTSNVASLYLYTTAWLRHEYARTINDLKAKRAALDGSLDI